MTASHGLLLLAVWVSQARAHLFAAFQLRHLFNSQEAACAIAEPPPKIDKGKQ
jgi:hypothetical protein